MALPALPAEYEDPWWTKRNVFDQAVKTEIDGRLSASQLGITYALVTHGHTMSNISDAATAIPAAVPAATESSQGKVELATASEALAGVDTTRAIHAAGLKAVGDTKAPLSHTHVAADITDLGSVAIPDATETVKGKAEIATSAEITTGTDDTRIVTPLKLQQRIAAIPPGSVADASETVKGAAEIATQAETTTGTDDTRIITPLKLAQRLLLLPNATEILAGLVELATAAETTAGTDNTRAVHPQGLKVELDKKAALAHTHTMANISDASTAIPAAVPSASETVEGKLELATLTEARAQTDTVRAITPYTMGETVKPAMATQLITPTGVGANCSINADGTVSFTSASGLTLDGIFTDTKYRRVKIYLTVNILSAQASIFFRFRDSTPANISTLFYQYNRIYGVNTSSTTQQSVNQGSIELAGASSWWHDVEITLHRSPGEAINRITAVTSSATGNNPLTEVPCQIAGHYFGSLTVRGFQIYPASGTMGGYCSVYGIA